MKAQISLEYFAMISVALIFFAFISAIILWSLSKIGPTERALLAVREIGRMVDEVCVQGAPARLQSYVLFPESVSPNSSVQKKAINLKLYYAGGEEDFVYFTLCEVRESREKPINWRPGAHLVFVRALENGVVEVGEE